MTEVIRFSETTSKTQHCTKVPVDLVTFTEKILNGKFHFLCSAGNVVQGSCCIFELSEWEGGCRICFELKIPQTSLTQFWKALKNFYQGK